MDESKKVIQLISAGAVEDYIKLAKYTGYRTGFRDGAGCTLLFEGMILAGGLTAFGAAVLIKGLVNKFKEDEDGSEQISGELECVENTEK